MELYIAEEYIEFTRIKHLSDGSVIREDMRREVADEHAAEIRKAKAEALRNYADALAAVPDYAPSDYDRGRVDQRHMAITELLERADRTEENL